MDTVTLKLTKEQAGNIDLLAKIPASLSHISQHDFGNGLIVSGKLSNMKVTASERGVKIENSLTKYYLGDNLQVMRRSDIERAIEKISDELHLPVKDAIATRFDFAKNIPLRQGIENYLNYFGEISRYQRYPSKRGINYKIAGRELAIYDKIAELKHNRETVPEIYEGKNIMRIEKRYLNKVASYFNMPVITGSHLFNEAFYIRVLNDWHNDYSRIDKLNNTVIDMSTVTTKRQLYSMGVLALVQMQGGEIAAIKQVQERLSKGELTKKQALDLRNAIKDSSRERLETKDNELLKELESKVKEAIAYYR